jgi:hypothetical protein
VDTQPSDKFFCGIPDANVVDGRPYCKGHAIIASNGIAVTLGLKRRQMQAAE